ncbi:MAG: hypothetical protein ACI957_004688 [Verrucomicrobiales bacterium]|jgi:hypothetical protein
MKDPNQPDQGAKCCHMDRRQFLRTTTGGALGATALSGALPLVAHAEAAKKSPKAETLVKTLFNTLTEEQRKAIAHPFDHDLRLKVDNNWHITKPRLGSEFYTPDQRAMVKDIFMGLHSPEYAETVYKQVVHDSGEAGFGDCSIGLFGEPDSGKFEFVLTGRHCTRRCDGDSVEGAAFGGPIFYGHAAESDEEKPDHPGNAYWYQAKRANQAFEMLDGKQREVALLGDARKERGYNTVKLTGKAFGLPGIRMSELSRDQRGEVKKVLADILAPYRQADVSEAMKLIQQSGFKNLHMAFYKNDDVGEDGIWDTWQIEGPSMVCFFRGDPHVHAWINIKKAPDAADAVS